MYDQLATLGFDTPEPRPLIVLDQQLADADPRTHMNRLRRDLDTLDHRRRELAAERAELSQPGQLADIDRHLGELDLRARDLAEQLDRHAAKASLWSVGHRPGDLAEAITRRSQHLAYSAIAGSERWLIEAVRAWDAAHPHGNVHRLLRTIIEIAAHRERSGHTGDDPLGPAPETADPLHANWQQLRSELHVDVDAATASLTV